MNKTQKKRISAETVSRLKIVYPEGICSLNSENPLQLLISTRLSAQCTDARVNQVTPALFSEFPTLESLCNADINRIEELIKSCGLYKTKARDIRNMCIAIRDKFAGVVPDSMEALLSLPGVGRKTANLVLGDVYGKPAIVADTHCIRISNRLGLTDSKDPYKVEMQLREVVEPSEGNSLCHRLVMFGRDTCCARSPKCSNCPLGDICPSKGKC